MAEAQSGFFARLKSGLSKTRSNLTDGLGNILLGEKKIDDDLLQEIDRQLLSADVGVKATRQIVENLTQSLRRNQLTDSVALYTELKRQLCLVLARCQVPGKLGSGVPAGMSMAMPMTFTETPPPAVPAGEV